MRTKKQKFAERHNRLAAICVECAKDSIREGYPRTADYFIGLAQGHQAMVKSYGF